MVQGNHANAYLVIFTDRGRQSATLLLGSLKEGVTRIYSSEVHLLRYTCVHQQH